MTKAFVLWACFTASSGVANCQTDRVDYPTMRACKTAMVRMVDSYALHNNLSDLMISYKCDRAGVP